MSDEELLRSLDTYACQLREANARLIYAAKARIEALRGENARLTEERDSAQRVGIQTMRERDEARADGELMSKAKQACEAENARLKTQVQFASETDPAMRAEAAEAEAEALRGEVDLIKTLGVGAALETVAQKERAQKAEAEAEALRGEVERLRSTFNAGTVEQILKVTQDRAEKAEAEAARLKVALAVIASDPTHSGQAMIARKALAGETT